MTRKHYLINKTPLDKIRTNPHNNVTQVEQYSNSLKVQGIEKINKVRNA
jgi:hypothetical protein